MPRDSDRRAEERRQTATIDRSTLGGVQPDPTPISGPAAVSLVWRLTQESWAAAGKEFPQYSRKEIPIRFVRRGSKESS